MAEQSSATKRMSRSELYAPSLPGAECQPPGGLAAYLAEHQCVFEDVAADRVQRQCTRRGQPLFLPAQRANRVYFLHRGAVAEFRPSREARSGLVAFINPGMLFGLQGFRYGLFDRSAEYKMECRALIDAEYCAIPSGVIAEGLRTNATIAETVTRSLCNRIQDNQLLLAFAADQDAERRMIAVVWMLATRIGVPSTEGFVVDGFSHAALAELMSTTRPTVTRLLARLEERHAVAVSRRQLVVPDPDLLIALLD